MAITLRTAGTWATSTGNPTVTLPTHQAGDMLLVRVAWKSDVAASASATISTTGWTKIGQGSNGTTNASNGGGSVFTAAFFKVAESSSETDPTVTFVDANPAAVVGMAYQKNSTEMWISPKGNSGPDTTSGTGHSATIASLVRVYSGDVVDFFTGIADDTTMTVPTITQTGVTFNTVTESPATALSSITGFDISADGGYRTATAGTATAAAVVTGTLSTSETGTSWMTVLRVMTPPPTGQAQAQIKAIGVNQHGQARSWIEVTFNRSAQARARIKNTYVGHGQAQAFIPIKGGYGQAQVYIAPTYTTWTDTFTRSVSDGVGTADSGDTYIAENATATRWDVNGSELVIDFASTGSNEMYTLQDTSPIGAVRGVEIAYKFKFTAIPNSGTLTSFVLGLRSARQVGSNTFTAGYASIVSLSGTTGNVSLRPLPEDQAGVNIETIFGYVADTFYRIKVQIIQDNLNRLWYKQKAWIDGDPEPTTWLQGFTSNGKGHPMLASPTIMATSTSVTDLNIVIDDIAITEAAFGESGQAQALIIDCYETEVRGDVPEAYWRLGESSGTTAVDVMVGHNGSYNNSPTLGEPGAVDGTNTAVRFNGTNQNMTADNNLDMGGSGAIEGWFKRERIGTTEWIVSMGTNQPNIFFNSGDDRLYVTDNDGPPFLRGPEITDTDWHYIAYSHESDDISAQFIYVDGLDATVDQLAGVTFAGNGSNFTVGSAYDGSNYFQGSVDEVAIYTYSLDDAIVADHYDKGINGCDGGDTGTNRSYGQAKALIKKTVPYPTLTYAEDTGTRDVASGFGNAAIGGAWSDNNSGTGFSVTDGKLVITYSGANQSRIAGLHAVSAQDTDYTWEFQADKTPVGDSIQAFLQSRQVDLNNYYKTRVQITSANAITLSLYKVVSAGPPDEITAETTIARETFAPDTVFKGRMQTFGTNPTTLRAKIWEASTPEPADWDITGSDSEAVLQAAEGIGIGGFTGSSVSNTPIVEKFDNVRVTGLLHTGLFAQAQASIVNTYRVYAQANARITGINYVHGQSQAWIENTYFGLGQAQGTIKQVYYGLGQAQADIKQTYYGLGQANAWIENTYYDLGQAQAQIKQTYYGLGQAQAQIKQVYFALGQAQADIKQTYYVVGQAQTDIKQTYRAFGQAQAQIKQVYYGLGQSQAQIKQVYFALGQAQADIKQTYRAFGQAQAWIKNSYYGLGQSQAQVKQVYYGLGQAQAAIKGNAFGQAQGSIKQVYYGLGQANAQIKQTYPLCLGGASEGSILGDFVLGETPLGETESENVCIGAFGQAQAKIAQTAIGTGQAQGWIENTYYGLGQAQASIKQAYTQTGQAQAWVEQTYYAHGQANAWIEQTYFGLGQAQGTILTTYYGLGQAQADIKQTYYVHGQAQAQIKQAYTQCGQSQADIKQTYFGLGQSNAWIEQTYFGLGQAQAQIKQVYNQHGQAQGTILQVYSETGQAQAQIKQTYNGSGQAQGTLVNTYYGLGQAQAKINAFGVCVHGQAQGTVRFEGNAVSGQAQAKINAFDYNQHGQAQGTIEQTYNQHGQAQGTVLQTYNQHGQGQGWIKNTYEGLGQAQGTILATAYVVGQAQAYIILVDQNGSGQAEALIKNTYYGSGQSNAKINAYDVNACGQAQAYILSGITVHGQANAYVKAIDINVHGQAQGWIETTYNSSGQAQGQIKNTYYGSGQANALVVSTAFVHGQAQGWIETTYNGHGQGQGSIKQTYVSCGQAQGQIKTTYYVSGQANALIGTRNSAVGQAQGTIKTTYNQSGQANADILQTYNASGQAQGRIKNTYNGSGQANAYIILNQFGTGQSQASILAVSRQYGQAQGTVLATYNRSGQAQALVKTTEQAHGQAAAVILNRYSASGQAQGQINNGGYAPAQAQAQIVLTGQISLAQAQAIIVKAALYGQAQALIVTVHTLKNVTVDDDAPIIITLSSEIITVTLEDDAENTVITSDDKITVELSDDSLLTLEINDEAF